MDSDKKIPGVNYSGPAENEALWHDFAGRYIAAEPDLKEVRIRALNLMDELAFGGQGVEAFLAANAPKDEESYKLFKGDMENVAVAISAESRSKIRRPVFREVCNSLANQFYQMLKLHKESGVDLFGNSESSAQTDELRSSREEFLKQPEAGFIRGILYLANQQNIASIRPQLKSRLSPGDSEILELEEIIFENTMYRYNPDRDGAASFHTYLRKRMGYQIANILIANRLSIYMYSSEAPLVNSFFIEMRDHFYTYNPESEAERRELSGFIRAGLEQLTEDERDVLFRHYVLEEKYNDISDEEGGRGARSVRAIANAALAKLRESITAAQPKGYHDKYKGIKEKYFFAKQEMWDVITKNGKINEPKDLSRFRVIQVRPANLSAFFRKNDVCGITENTIEAFCDIARKIGLEDDDVNKIKSIAARINELAGEYRGRQGGGDGYRYR